MPFKIFSKFLFFFIACKLIFFFNNALAEILVIDRIYLIVNSQMLTRSEAIDLLSSFKSQNTSTIILNEQLYKKFLKNLIQELLLLDRANSLKIYPSTKEINNRLEKLSKKQPELLNVYNEDDLKEQISKEFKKHRVIDREIGTKIHLETSEIINFCKQHIRKDRKVGLSQILLKGSENEVKEKVKLIRTQFSKGEKFDDLAKTHSVDPNAKITGGKLGIFKTDDLLPKIGSVVSNLESGEISKLVNTEIGNHLLYVYEEIFPENINCENMNKEKESQFYNFLYDKKRNSFLEKYLNELFLCANIKIKDPGDTDLPNSDFLPIIKKNKVNCQDRRIMVLPKKKEKNSPRGKT